MRGQEVSTSQELVTDRPDATEAPTVVPAGSLQVETGALFSSFDKENTLTKVYTYNTTLLRYGILDNVELRVGWNLDEIQTTIDKELTAASKARFSPLLFGAKVAIAQEKGWKPEIGLIGHLFLPFTAPKEVRPQYTSADFRFAFNHSLSENSGLAYNVGAQWESDDPEIAYIYTLAYGYSFTDKFGTYVELYGDFPEDSNANHFWDAGVTYLVSPLMQLDATIGQSITDGQDILVSVGVSFRIDKKQ
tara:strand:- start:1712 stop:2455 length:744 start_codon:yes stop_codon:yes gene_type:complete